MSAMTHATAAPATTPSVTLHALTRACPVSYAQESLWSPSGQSAINVPAVVRFRGRLDRPRLFQALDTLAERHDALRTVLWRSPEGVLEQHVAPAGSLPVDTVEHPDTLEHGLPALLLAGSERPFRLDGEPLVRAELHGFGPEDQLLIVWMHHAVTDLAATRVVVEEIKQLYTGVQPEPVRSQQCDYAVYERALRADAEQERYWKDALGSADDRIGLPVPDGTDHLAVRPALPLLPAEIVEPLGRLAASHRTTLTAVLATAVLATHADEADGGRMVLGLTMSNRDHPRFRSTVGCLTDQLPLVVDTAGSDLTFSQLLDRVRAAMLDAYDHRLPLGVLLPLLGRRRPPVFAINLNFLPLGPNLPAPAETWDVEVGDVEFPYGIVKRRPDPWWLGDAVLAYRPRLDGRGLGGEIEGDAGIHGLAAVTHYGARFGALLAGAAWNPELPVHTLTDRSGRADRLG